MNLKNYAFSREQLTPTELSVLKQVILGKTNKSIAEILCVTDHTIETHVSNILNKTGFKNRTQLTFHELKYLQTLKDMPDA